MTTAKTNAPAVPAAPVAPISDAEKGKIDAKANSQKAAQDAMNATAQSPWLSGLPFGVYTDSYNPATGELETFYTSSSYTGTGAARALKPEGQRKIGGRMVLNQANQKVKLYNGFVALIANVSGVTAIDIKDAEGTELGKFTSIEGASFGIFAVQTDEDSNQELPADSPLRQAGQTHYKVIRHLLQATERTPKPTKESLVAA